MYKDLRPKQENPPPHIIIKLVEFSCECSGCPTIFNFSDEEDTQYYFRLRHGTARIVCEDTDETLACDSMPGHDGVCSFADMIDFAAKHGIQINM